MDLLRKVEYFIQQNELLSNKDRVVMGISGGADSMCLLELMCKLKNQYSLQLVAVHVNHGIRGETAEADAQYVVKECEKRCVECRVISCDVPKLAAEFGQSVEEAGREARYSAFYQVAEEFGGAKIAVAHNRNDSAETFLFHAFRGTGLAGLCGILPRRGNIIRPLVCATRSEIEKYLADAGILYRTDETNFFLDYTRNCIRHSILNVAVEQVNAKAVEHLANVAEELAGVAEVLRQQTLEIYHKIADDIEEPTAFRVQISIHEWEHLPRVIGDEVLLYALEKLAGKRKNIGRVHVNQLRDLAKGMSGRQISLPYRMIACRSYNILEISKEKLTAGNKKDLFVPAEDIIQKTDKFQVISEESAAETNKLEPAFQETAEQGKKALSQSEECVTETNKFEPAFQETAEQGKKSLPESKESAAIPNKFEDISDISEKRIRQANDCFTTKNVNLEIQKWDEDFEFPCMPVQSSAEEKQCEITKLPFQLEFGGWIFSLRKIAYEKNAEIPKNGYTKWFDYDKISNTLTLRTRREGDYMVIHKDGMKKSLKSLLIDRKIHWRERDNILLLTAGSRVLWAVGVRSENGLYVSENTKHILVAELRRRG